MAWFPHRRISDPESVHELEDSAHAAYGALEDEVWSAGLTRQDLRRLVRWHKERIRTLRSQYREQHRG